MTELSQVEMDGREAFDCIRAGGVAIVCYDVGYAILSATDDALRRVYEAKGRSWSKASAVVCCPEMAEAIHVLPPDRQRMVRAITIDHGLPLSVVAPFREDDPFMRRMTPFIFEVGTREGTVAFLHNAGPIRDAIGRHCWREKVPALAAAARRSLQGAKYEVKDIEPEVLAAADVVIDRGPSRYNKVKNVSTTQIDFRTMTLNRRGHCFEAIEAILRDDFGVTLKLKA